MMATALLRFVQSKIRYMGIELGSSSYIPNAPRTILQRRFSDCEDKTVLLISLLRAIGISAHPVLVNTDKTAFLHNTLPGLTQFDHVITQLTMSGKTYWVDPTITGDEFYLYLSAEGGGDRKFIEQLKRSSGTKH